MTSWPKITIFFPIFLIFFRFGISSAHAVNVEPSEFRGKDYSDINYGNGTHVWTGGLEEWVLDSGIYLPYIVSETPDEIKFDSKQYPFILNKNDCTLAVYDNDLRLNQNPGILIEKEYWTVEVSQIGTNQWNDIDLLSFSCSTSYVTNSTGFYLTVTRNDDTKGKIVVDYVKKPDQDFKISAEFTNMNASWNDHKFRFVEKMSNVISDKFNIGSTKIQNFLGTDRSQFVNYNDVPAKIVSFIKTSKNPFLINLEQGYNDFQGMQIGVISGKADIDFVFGRGQEKLSISELMKTDPTYGYDSGSTRNVYNTAGAPAGTTCPIPNTNVVDSPYVFLPNTNNSPLNSCFLSVVQWDITSIPDGSTITNTTIETDIFEQYDGKNCDMTQITNKPSTASASTLWDDILGNISDYDYVSNNSICTSSSLDTVFDLGSAGDSHVQSQLASDWFAVGSHYTDMTRDSLNRFIILYNSLQVTYNGGNPPTSPTGLTATTISSTQIDLSWTAPNDGGSPIIGYKIERESPVGGGFSTLVANTGNTLTTYSDTGLAHSTQYNYRVSAINSVGTGTTSNEAAATTFITSTDPRLDSSGEQRVTYFDGTRNWMFYYNGVNIEYRFSTDNGATFSAASTIPSSSLLANSYFGVYGESNAVIVSFSTSANVVTKKGTIDPVVNTISWGSNVNVFPIPSGANAGKNYYPSFEKVGSNLFLGFNVGSGANKNTGRVHFSSDLGGSWLTANGKELYKNEANAGVVGVAKYASSKTVAVYAKYSDTSFKYRTYNGLWSAESTSPPAGLVSGLKTNAFSIASDGTCAWVGYVPSNAGGDLDTMKFCDGSITFPPDFIPVGNVNPTISSVGSDMHLYYARGNVIYSIVRFPSDWSVEAQPFGTAFSNVCCLHAAKNNVLNIPLPIVWREGTSPSFIVKYGKTDAFSGSIFPTYSNFSGSPINTEPGGCQSLPSSVTCDVGYKDTGEIRLYNNLSGVQFSIQKVDFNKNPHSGNSPVVGFASPKQVYWGSVSDSFGLFDAQAHYSGQYDIGIDLYKCDVPSTTTCSGNWGFVQFIGNTQVSTTTQEITILDNSYHLAISQDPGYLYTAVPHGSIGASVGINLPKNPIPGSGITNWGGEVPGDPHYMKIKRIYALWP